VIAGERPRVRNPLVGYGMVLVAATLFGINGSVAKVALSSGLSSLRLTEARCAGACLGLLRRDRRPCRVFGQLVIETRYVARRRNVGGEFFLLFRPEPAA